MAITRAYPGSVLTDASGITRALPLAVLEESAAATTTPTRRVARRTHSIRPSRRFKLDDKNIFVRKLNGGDVWSFVGDRAGNYKAHNNKNFSLANLSGSTTGIVSSAKGPGLASSSEVNADGAYIDSTTLTLHGLSEFSMFVVFYYSGVHAADPVENELFRESTGSDAGVALALIAPSGVAKLRGIINTTGVSTWGVSYDLNISSYQHGWYVAGMTYNGQGRNLYMTPLGEALPYRRTDSNTGTVNIAGTSTKRLSFGGGQHTNCRGYYSPIILAYLAKKYLSDAEVQKFTKNPWQIFKPRSIYQQGTSTPSTPPSGGTVYTVDASDGIYMWDGRDSTNEKLYFESMFMQTLAQREMEKLQRDANFLGETATKELESTQTDGVLFSGSITKLLEKQFLDTLFMLSSVTTELGAQGLEITATDYLLLKETHDKIIEKNIQEALFIASSLLRMTELYHTQGLLLQADFFNEIDINRYDAQLFSEKRFTEMERLGYDALLADDTDKIFFLREMFLRDNLFLYDSLLSQLYTTVVASLVYAKLRSKDLLGIKLQAIENFLGMKLGMVGDTN